MTRVDAGARPQSSSYIDSQYEAILLGRIKKAAQQSASARQNHAATRTQEARAEGKTALATYDTAMSAHQKRWAKMHAYQYATQAAAQAAWRKDWQASEEGKKAWAKLAPKLDTYDRAVGNELRVAAEEAEAAGKDVKQAVQNKAGEIRERNGDGWKGESLDERVTTAEQQVKGESSATRKSAIAVDKWLTLNDKLTYAQDELAKAEESGAGSTLTEYWNGQVNLARQAVEAALPGIQEGLGKEFDTAAAEVLGVSPDKLDDALADMTDEQFNKITAKLKADHGGDPTIGLWIDTVGSARRTDADVLEKVEEVQATISEIGSDLSALTDIERKMWDNGDRTTLAFLKLAGVDLKEEGGELVITVNGKEIQLTETEKKLLRDDEDHDPDLRVLSLMLLGGIRLDEQVVDGKPSLKVTIGGTESTDGDLMLPVSDGNSIQWVRVRESKGGYVPIQQTPQGDWVPMLQRDNQWVPVQQNKAGEWVPAKQNDKGEWVAADGGKPISVLTNLDQFGVNKDLLGPAVTDGSGNSLLDLGYSLMPNIQLSPDQKVLMSAAGVVRTQDTRTVVQNKLKAGDDNGAMQALTTNLNAAFSTEERQKIWTDVGMNLLGRDFIKEHLQTALAKPSSDPMVNDTETVRAREDSTIYADKVGRWMQDILRNAPPEFASLVLDVVKDELGKDWQQANNDTATGATRGLEFYKGLSMAVELAPQHADDVAAWLMDAGGEAGWLIPMLHGQSFLTTVRSTMSEGFGETLSKAIAENMARSEDGRYSEFGQAVEIGDQEWQEKEGRTANRLQFDDLNANEGRIVNPYFKHVLGGDWDVTQLQSMSGRSEHWLDNFIGTANGWTPDDKAAAAAGDHSKAWFTSPIQAMQIDVISGWINKEVDGDGWSIRAVPVIYASERDGYSYGALFQLKGPEVDEEAQTTPTYGRGGYAYTPKKVQKEVWIDGLVAPQIAAPALGDPSNKADDKDPELDALTYKYDSLRDFQDDNYLSEDGRIYLPYDLVEGMDPHGLKRFDGNSDIGVITAGRHTGWETVKFWGSVTAALAGFVAAPFTGFQSLWISGAAWATIGVTATFGVVVTVDDLARMHGHGQSIGLNNRQARSSWIGLLGSAGGITASSLSFASKFGLLAKFGTFSRNFSQAGAVSGNPVRMQLGAAGMNLERNAPTIIRGAEFLDLGTGGYLTIEQGGMMAANWEDMSDRERNEGMVMFFIGLSQVAVGLLALRGGHGPQAGQRTQPLNTNTPQIGPGGYPGGHRDGNPTPARYWVHRAADGSVRTMQVMADGSIMPVDGTVSLMENGPEQIAIFETADGPDGSPVAQSLHLMQRGTGGAYRTLVLNADGTVRSDGDAPGSGTKEDSSDSPDVRVQDSETSPRALPVRYGELPAGFRPADGTGGSRPSPASLPDENSANSLPTGYRDSMRLSDLSEGDYEYDLVADVADVFLPFRLKYSRRDLRDPFDVIYIVSPELMARNYAGLHEEGDQHSDPDNVAGYVVYHENGRPRGMVFRRDLANYQSWEHKLLMAHEFAHYYIHPDFAGWANATIVDPNKPNSNFAEGAAEYIAHTLMEGRTNFKGSDFGYVQETRAVARIVEMVGKDTFYAAYFGGDLKASRAVQAAAQKVLGSGVPAYRPGMGTTRPAPATSRRASYDSGYPDNPAIVNAGRVIDETQIEIDGRPVSAHEVLFQPDFWTAYTEGQPIVLNTQGAEAHVTSFAQNLANAANAEVFISDRTGTVPWQSVRPVRGAAKGTVDLVNGAVLVTAADGTQQTVSPEQIIGGLIAGGSDKSIFEFGDKVAAIWNDGTLEDAQQEATLLNGLRSTGLPTLNAHGPIKLFGRPALIYDRYAVGSKEILHGNGRYVDDTLLNENSLADLQAIRRTLVEKGIQLWDLQLLVGSDGHVVVADPFGVTYNSKPTPADLALLDTFIAAAEDKIARTASEGDSGWSSWGRPSPARMPPVSQSPDPVRTFAAGSHQDRLRLISTASRDDLEMIVSQPDFALVVNQHGQAKGLEVGAAVIRRGDELRGNTLRSDAFYAELTTFALSDPALASQRSAALVANSQDIIEVSEFGPVLVHDPYSNPVYSERLYNNQLLRLEALQGGEIPEIATHPMLGPVALPWGEASKTSKWPARTGFGLTRMAEFRPGAIPTLPDLIEQGTVSKPPATRNIGTKSAPQQVETATLKSGGYTINLIKDPSANTSHDNWIVTTVYDFRTANAGTRTDVGQIVKARLWQNADRAWSFANGSHQDRLQLISTASRDELETIVSQADFAAAVNWRGQSEGLEVTAAMIRHGDQLRGTPLRSDSFYADLAAYALKDPALTSGRLSALFDDTQDITAVSEFGPVLVPGRYNNQALRLEALQGGEIPQIAEHPILGAVSLQWGDASPTTNWRLRTGFGLTRIAQYRPEIIATLPELIKKGTVSKPAKTNTVKQGSSTQTFETATLLSGDYTINLVKDPAARTDHDNWIVTKVYKNKVRSAATRTDVSQVVEPSGDPIAYGSNLFPTWQARLQSGFVNPPYDRYIYVVQVPSMQSSSMVRFEASDIVAYGRMPAGGRDIEWLNGTTDVESPGSVNRQFGEPKPGYKYTFVIADEAPGVVTKTGGYTQVVVERNPANIPGPAGDAYQQPRHGEVMRGAPEGERPAERGWRALGLAKWEWNRGSGDTTPEDGRYISPHVPGLIGRAALPMQWDAIGLYVADPHNHPNIFAHPHYPTLEAFVQRLLFGKNNRKGLISGSDLKIIFSAELIPYLVRMNGGAWGPYGAMDVGEISSRYAHRDDWYMLDMFERLPDHLKKHVIPSLTGIETYAVADPSEYGSGKDANRYIDETLLRYPNTDPMAGELNGDKEIKSQKDGRSPKDTLRPYRSDSLGETGTTVNRALYNVLEALRDAGLVTVLHGDGGGLEIGKDGLPIRAPGDGRRLFKQDRMFMQLGAYDLAGIDVNHPDFNLAGLDAGAALRKGRVRLPALLIHAHLKGIGNYVRDPAHHMDYLDWFFQQPLLEHIYLDSSWQPVIEAMMHNPKFQRRIVEAIRTGRIIYAGDVTNFQTLEQFGAPWYAQQDTLKILEREDPEALVKYASGTFLNLYEVESKPRIHWRRYRAYRDPANQEFINGLPAENKQKLETWISNYETSHPEVVGLPVDQHGRQILPNELAVRVGLPATGTLTVPRQGLSDKNLAAAVHLQVTQGQVASKPFEEVAGYTVTDNRVWERPTAAITRGTPASADVVENDLGQSPLSRADLEALRTPEGNPYHPEAIRAADVVDIPGMTRGLQLVTLLAVDYVHTRQDAANASVQKQADKQLRSTFITLGVLALALGGGGIAANNAGFINSHVNAGLLFERGGSIAWRTKNQQSYRKLSEGINEEGIVLPEMFGYMRERIQKFGPQLGLHPDRIDGATQELEQALVDLEYVLTTPLNAAEGETMDMRHAVIQAIMSGVIPKVEGQTGATWTASDPSSFRTFRGRVISFITALAYESGAFVSLNALADNPDYLEGVARALGNVAFATFLAGNSTFAAYHLIGSASSQFKMNLAEHQTIRKTMNFFAWPSIALANMNFAAAELMSGNYPEGIFSTMLFGATGFLALSGIRAETGWSPKHPFSKPTQSPGVYKPRRVPQAQIVAAAGLVGLAATHFLRLLLEDEDKKKQQQQPGKVTGSTSPTPSVSPSTPANTPTPIPSVSSPAATPTSTPSVTPTPTPSRTLPRNIPIGP